jgi:hypothetical protein
MPVYSGTQSVEVREAAWLNTIDSLPVLPSSAGGPFDVLQPFWTRTPATQKTQLYVWSSTFDDERVANIRIRPHYDITLAVYWPVRVTAGGVAETEQQNAKNAVDLLIQRIRGFPGDKTHGGAFLSAGEVPRVPGIHVAWEPPWVTIPADKELRCTVTYPADDFEIND